MVILNFIQYRPDCQTTLEYFIETRAFCNYYDSLFCNHGQLGLKTIKTNSENHHIIIFPNENMLAQKDKVRSLNMLKQTKTTKTN